MLSRTIKRAFDHVRCCSGYVHIDIKDARFVSSMGHAEGEVERRQAMMPYVQYASSLRIIVHYMFPFPPKRRKNLLLSIRKSLVSGALKSLYMRNMR
jgi:hypothetical protein